MHKSNKLSHDLIQSWKKNWPSYVSLAEYDEKPIIEIAEKCARVARVDLDVEAGFNRVMAAIGSIAAFCSTFKEWRSKNMYQINQALQSVLMDMMAKKRAMEEEEYEQTAVDRSFQYQSAERNRIEKEMAEASERLKKEHEKTWSAEDEVAYQNFMRQVTPGRVIYMHIAEEKSVNKAL